MPAGISRSSRIELQTLHRSQDFDVTLTGFSLAEIDSVTLDQAKALQDVS
jgi:hypothetical protein